MNHPSPEKDQKIQYLKGLFTHCSSFTIVDALVENNWDEDKAFKTLKQIQLSLTVETKKEGGDEKKEKQNSKKEGSKASPTKKGSSDRIRNSSSSKSKVKEKSAVKITAYVAHSNTDMNQYFDEIQKPSKISTTPSRVTIEKIGSPLSKIKPLLQSNYGEVDLNASSSFDGSSSFEEPKLPIPSRLVLSSNYAAPNQTSLSNTIPVKNQSDLSSSHEIPVKNQTDLSLSSSYEIPVKNQPDLSSSYEIYSKNDQSNLSSSYEIYSKNEQGTLSSSNAIPVKTQTNLSSSYEICSKNDPNNLSSSYEIVSNPGKHSNQINLESSYEIAENQSSYEIKESSYEIKESSYEIQLNANLDSSYELKEETDESDPSFEEELQELQKENETLIESFRVFLPKELTTRVQSLKWNDEFQKIYQALVSSEDTTELIQRMYDLSVLYADFKRVCLLYAKRIIDEKNVETKSIGSIDVGGIAGGEKFSREGIFFKFNLDEHNLYGGASNAAKAAYHELKNTDFISTFLHKKLKFPLFAVVDYRGYQISCMTLLPIGKTTQIYGSCDGGMNVSRDSRIHPFIDKLCKKMNLEEHICTDKTLRSACDLEGHLGTDGRFYLLDVARLMPPEPPSRAFPGTEKWNSSVFNCNLGGFLYRLLRPEFVLQSKEALCNDTFSKFVQNDPKAKEYEDLILCSYRELINNVCLKFAVELDEITPRFCYWKPE